MNKVLQNIAITGILAILLIPGNLIAQDTLVYFNFDDGNTSEFTTGATGLNGQPDNRTSWEIGIPHGGRGYSNVRGYSNFIGNPDPTMDHTTDDSINYVYGQGLSYSSKANGISGYYNNSDEWLMTPEINCTDYYNTQLVFWRWANVEAKYDEAYVEISTDGVLWTDLGHTLYPQDENWTEVVMDISGYADRQASVYIRWRLVSDGTIFYSGWNIDDVKITGIYSPVTFWTGDFSDDWSDYRNWSTNKTPDEITTVIIDANTPFSPTVDTNGNCKNISIRKNAVLTIENGSNLEVFGDISVETDATGYGSLLDKGNLTLHGNGIMSRHLSSKKWYYISSPFKSVSSDLFGTNIYRYNEPQSADNWSNGWEQVLNDTLVPGTGYDVSTYKDSEIKMEGQFNTGEINIIISNTNGNEVPEHEGWNLVGNPYPSTIDWDAPTGWTKTNVNDAIYIWDNKKQNFITYVSGVGTNGGSRYIPPMQGFFVKVNSPGTGSLTMNNEVRNISTEPLLKTADFKNELTFKISNQTYSDEAVISFKQGAIKGFESNSDAEKKFSLNSDVPQIYTRGEETNPLAINTLPDNNEYYKIKIYSTINKPGEYSITVNGINTFEFSKTIYLEDLALDTIIDLSNTQEYFFETNAVQDSARFIVHVNMPLTVTYSVKHVSEGNTNDGAIDLNIMGGVQPLLGVEWSNGNDTEDLENLEAGEYTFTVTDYNFNTYSETVVVQQSSTNSILSPLDDNNSEDYIRIFAHSKKLYAYMANENIVTDQISIYDLTGKLCYHDSRDRSGSFNVDLDLPSGIYIVNLINNGKLNSEKILLE